MLIPCIKEFVQYIAGMGIFVNISINGRLPHAINACLEIMADHVNIGFAILVFSETHNTLTAADNFLKALSSMRSVIAQGKDPISDLFRKLPRS